MVKVKSQQEIQANYTGSIAVVPGRYRQGVAGASGVIAASIAAEDLYAAKLQESIAARRRANALSKVSDDEWRRKATELGAARIGPGMQANAQKQAQNFEPFRSALSALSLPARTADPIANVDRVRAVVETMVATKRSVKG